MIDPIAIKLNIPIHRIYANNLIFESSNNACYKTFDNNDVESLVEMSNAENRQLLYKIGEAASSSVLKSHFE